ncbi:MAG: hypothetical protein OXF76_08675 [Caldilineaceae bacterium]|nr:hypothetical protein [Caldilineaceae bacterium]
MADNGRSDRFDRIERIQDRTTEQIAANWKVIKANTELITRLGERQDRTQRQIGSLHQEVRFLLASVQGHVAQAHPPAHAGDNPAPPRTAAD